MDFAPILAAPTQIKVHLAAAVLAIVIGSVVLLNAKGTRFHKAFGWTYVMLMATTAVTAIFIRRPIGEGPFGEGSSLYGFTPIHLFVLLTLVGLPRALVAIRRGNVGRHARAMIGLYAGGLIIAGILAFLPGRIMHDVVFGG